MNLELSSSESYEVLILQMGNLCQSCVEYRYVQIRLEHVFHMQFGVSTFFFFDTRVQ